MPRTRTSQARAAVLGAKLAPPPPATTPLPVVPVPDALDVLVAELRPMVFRLLDAGKVGAAGALVETYAEQADAALWRDVLGPGSTGSLRAVRA